MSPNYAPLVTVYITSHNYGRYLQQAIDSVLAQTLQDFELIIIDDGSTDDSPDIIERNATHQKVVPIYQHNQGLNVTNNIAIRAARGKSVMRLDADDYLDEHILEVLCGVLERNPDVGLVFPDYYRVDAEGQVLELVRRHDFDDVTLHDQPAHGACTMIRRKCLQELGGYDESFHCQDGYDLWIRFIEKYEVRNVNLPLFYYRHHPSSLTQNEERLLETRAEIMRRHASRRGKIARIAAIVAVRGPKFEPDSPALRHLGGRPLMDWTLQAALDAERVTGVVLTTPDRRLLDHAHATYGDRVILHEREGRLALPNTYIEDTLFDALAYYERTHSAADAIMHLSIESPFRSSRHLNSAVDVMELFDTDVVVGVRPENAIFFQHDGTGLSPLRQCQELRLEREDLYRQVGGMWLTSVDHLRRTGNVLGGRVGHVVLDQRASLSLRSPFDWSVAESQAVLVGAGQNRESRAAS